MQDTLPEALYPRGLLDWAGHRGGGVRRLFYEKSGRPSQTVIDTPLLRRLGRWADECLVPDSNSPRILLLIGGPGNGKTEAVEFSLHRMDRSMNLGGELVRSVSAQFSVNASAIPRLAHASVNTSNGTRNIAIVQDASVIDSERPLISPAELFVEDLEQYVNVNGSAIYLACVNRGVLDDALTVSSKVGSANTRALIESIIRSVGLSPNATSCWPLHEYPSVAVWPMDVETLVGDDPNEGVESPASQVLFAATSEARWPISGTCPAGDHCPYCTSREFLSRETHRTSFLKILRWYELASGKRWSFRDLFSLISHLLSGAPTSVGSSNASPCEWAANQIELANRPGGKAESLKAPFLLVAAQYQHSLFATWPRGIVRQFRKDLLELRLNEQPAFAGLALFLNTRRSLSIPTTLDAQLNDLCELLDPALSDPDATVSVSAQTEIRFREIDVRFSQSINEGYKFVQKYQCLTKLESELLRKLAEADQILAKSELASRKPRVANRVRSVARDFACRLVRRSLGVRSAEVRDASILADFQSVIDGESQLLADAVKEIRGLLNENRRFVVNLNTTFGEPLPPTQRRAVLRTEEQKVRPSQPHAAGRPKTPVVFLDVGTTPAIQSIPLTYELFKSVKELRKGMMAASLPRPVVALLDTTRARLAGSIVRDENRLDGAEIRIGNRDEFLERQLGKFVVRQEGEE